MTTFGKEQFQAKELVQELFLTKYARDFQCRGTLVWELPTVEDLTSVEELPMVSIFTFVRLLLENFMETETALAGELLCFQTTIFTETFIVLTNELLLSVSRSTDTPAKSSADLSPNWAGKSYGLDDRGETYC